MNAHGGTHAIKAAQAHGVDVLFTLSGGHLFALYEGAVKGDPPMRIVDVRHEQSAVFAAEAYAKLTRTPGFAALTAGPGVTNGVSAITTAQFNGTPMVVLGGRAPAARWGSGSLQELDQPPILAPVTKHAATVASTEAIFGDVDAAFGIAQSPRRGPVFLDIAMDVLFSYADAATDSAGVPAGAQPDAADLSTVADLVARAERPVLVVGSDVWWDRAETAVVRAVEALQLPVIANGMGRGVVPADHPLAFSRVRGAAFKEADLVLVAGTPLDFRLAFGSFGDAAVVHLVSTPDLVATHAKLAASVAGDLAATFTALASGGAGDRAPWVARLRAEEDAKAAEEVGLLTTDTSPIHPARVYGALREVLDRDAVVIGDGGDFVSYAGKYVESYQPGCWLDPGPYGCLGTGLGYAIGARLARPEGQVVLLLGDGAAGFSLMDVDTLVRHNLPVVMVCGNNGIWGLEKHPMQFLYGWDVAADLQPQTRYDEVVRALGGHGELVTEASELVPALRRAFDSGKPAMVNVITDPAVAYPRSSNLA